MEKILTEQAQLRHSLPSSQIHLFFKFVYLAFAFELESCTECEIIANTKASVTSLFLI